MKIRTRPVLIILSCIFLAGNIMLGYSVYNSHQKLEQSRFLVKHTELLIKQSADILTICTDIETAARGYIITKDSLYLKPLVKAEKTIFISIAQLSRLCKDNPVQIQRIDSLKYYVNKHLNFALQMVELRSKPESLITIEYASIFPGYFYSESIRRIIGDFQQEENILLLKREQINESSISVFIWLSVTMLILMITFTILLIIATSNYLVQNEHREKRQLQLLITNLELSFQHDETEKRAAELKIANKELLFQNEEKEKRAAELISANNELFVQKEEKAKKTADLIIANRELHFQNEE